MVRGMSYLPPKTSANTAAAAVTCQLRCMKFKKRSTGDHRVAQPGVVAFDRGGSWVASWAIPGMGMFCEAYYIFSVGNVKPLWAAQWPNCFNVSFDSISYLSHILRRLILMGCFRP